MAQIYRNARQTVVYLGSSTPQIDQLFGTIQAKKFMMSIADANAVFVSAVRYVVFSVIPPRLWEVLYHSEVKDPTLKTKSLPSWVSNWTLDKDSLPDPPWFYVDKYEIVDPSSEDSDNSKILG
ncbi:uncharacterized protein Bfra_012251 [Botrytis fragariae]|uniref:Uncharacterized protein n=1 Tax=Botrytis fragariae TaxID=1964551 RepID=A0A8H6EDR9_9HELO|nr:uncharacterized protein Bfra_012251 [Botrytis fragariae]KAF5868604.1 hypothetical protein Bfra_012251 [Botrytis fragariae]